MRDEFEEKVIFVVDEFVLYDFGPLVLCVLLYKIWKSQGNCGQDGCRVIKVSFDLWWSTINELAHAIGMLGNEKASVGVYYIEQEVLGPIKELAELLRIAGLELAQDLSR